MTGGFKVVTPEENAVFGDSMASAVMQWPEDFARRARDLLLRMSDVSSLSTDEMAQLVSHGLLDEQHKPTPTGSYLWDLIVHESWQANDEVPQYLQRGAERLGGDILDVGCSTGWTLRQMRNPVPRTRTGVDIDEPALALATRLAKAEGQQIRFLKASVHELPFPNQSFDWVICRNALSYTHQRTAIREMTRVLRPGGYLLLRFENIRYDLELLAHARSLKALLCRMRDLAYGIVHAVTGLQMVPGGLLRGGRAMVSVYRVSRYLRAGDLNVIQTDESRQCPIVLGKANQTSMLSRKRSSLAVAPAEGTLLTDGSSEMVRRQSGQLAAD